MAKRYRIKALFLVVVTLGVLFGATEASAVGIIYNNVADPCPTYDSCAYGSPDWNANWNAPFSGPDTTQCVAIGSNNQRCRTCVPEVRPDGQETGRTFCGYVADGYSCYCDFSTDGLSTCSGKGVCHYY